MSSGAAPSAAAPPPTPADAPASTTRKANGGGGKKQRILWDSDSATRGGKTSIAVLLEWLTAPGNYARWRSGKSQFGETREALCSEIKAEMKLHGILHRENANIRTQISELERSYEVARAWMAKHGYASDSLRPSSDDEALADGGDAAASASANANGEAPSSRSAIESTVLRLCRYFHVLDPIMRQTGDDAAGVRAKRPYAPRKRKERESDEQQPASRTAADATGKREATRLVDSVATANGADRRGPAATPKRDVDITPTQPSNPIAATTAPASLPLGAFPVPDLSSLSMPMGSIPMAAPGLFPPWGNPALMSGFEESKRLFMESTREERERKRKQFEWDEERAQLERERLRLELETARLRVATERAVARRRMEDARVPASEIDRIIASASAGSN